VPGRTEEPNEMLKTEKATGTPPGEFVNEDLERDCARFLAELRKRAADAEGIRPQSEK
jgi:hypothetical protein